jgi:hypothetical protein
VVVAGTATPSAEVPGVPEATTDRVHARTAHAKLRVWGPAVAAGGAGKCDLPKRD